MVLPPVVGGTALLFALGRRGLVGQWLDRWFDITLPFTMAGAVVAATFVALPFYVMTVEGALRTMGDDLEQMAGTLGAPPLTVLRRITLPRLLPAMGAGLALAWARALGEFGATITFAGNLPGRTRTLPLATFQALESDPEAALALSLVLLAVSLVVLLPTRDRWLPTR
jgi:molybdate transport system permease protein